MPNYRIVVDSTSDLSKKLAEKHNITIVPLKVIVDGVDYIDGVDFTPEEYLVKMAETRELPTTSQPAPGVFAEAFEKIKSEGAEPISILISQKLSGTCQSAVIASQIAEVGDRVIDSKFSSLPVSWMALEAAKMADSGKSFEEINAKVNKMIENSHVYFGLQTVENLVKGGRLSKAKGTLTSILNIKPVITFEDGMLVPHNKVRGFAQIPNYLLGKLKADMKHEKISHIGVIHCGNTSAAENLKAEINVLLPEHEVDVVDTSAAIATQVGAGVLAITYVTE